MDSQQNLKLLLDEFRAEQNNEIIILEKICDEAHKQHPRVVILAKLKKEFIASHENSMKILNQCQILWEEIEL